MQFYHYVIILKFYNFNRKLVNTNIMCIINLSFFLLERSCLCVVGPKIWNSLPVNVKISNSLSCFKKIINDLLLN